MGLENLQNFEITKQYPLGVTYDSEAVSLDGRYTDEISLHRAKKLWRQVLEGSFLLESNHDFKLMSSCSPDSGSFTLSATFLSACGRYAFWRLINNQSPEAQYLIETAHIPQCESRSEDFLRAPDLRPHIKKSLDKSAEDNSTSASLVKWLVQVLGKQDK